MQTNRQRFFAHEPALFSYEDDILKSKFSKSRPCEKAKQMQPGFYFLMDYCFEKRAI